MEYAGITEMTQTVLKNKKKIKKCICSCIFPLSSKLLILLFYVVVLLMTSKNCTPARMCPARATRFFITVVARKSEKRIARAGFKFLRAT